MTPFLLESITVDFESGQSMVALPYSGLSKSLFIKQLSTKQAFEWTCTFQLLKKFYFEIQNCHLRIQIPPNRSCA